MLTMPEEQPTQSTSKHTSSRFAYKGILEVKEQGDDLVVKGYVATTHFDGQDIIQEETLHKWAGEINQGIPIKNKLSIHHDRQPQVAGVGIKGTAKVDMLPDGEYGLYVESKINRAIDNYEGIKYEIDNDMLDSFSIEYYPPDEPDYSGSGARILDKTTDLRGWTLASRPMNQYAVMVKEIVEGNQQRQQHQTNNKEDNDGKMTEEQPVKEQPVKEQASVEEQKPILSKEDQELLDKAKLQQKESEMKSTLLKMMESKELQDKFKEAKPESKPLANKEEEENEDKVEETPEEKEKKEISLQYKSVVTDKTVELKEKFRQVGLLAEKEGLVWSEGIDSLGYKTSTKTEPGMGFKEFKCNGSKMEYKALGITTNQNSDTDYLLSAAELRDMFDPVIYDALNQSTTTWGLLNKEDYSMKGNNQVQFVLETGANGTAAFYTGNSVSTGNSDLQKYMTKFKKVQVGISVDGDMIAAAKGGPVGDVFGLHVGLGTKNMLSTVNSALFAENGAETDAECIGFEYITDSAGNTTLYNVTRSSTNRLSPDSASDTYINASSARISPDLMRQAIEQAVKEGADINNLIFIAHPTQERLFKGIYDATQRLMPTSSRFGFEGRPEFDSIPIFADKDCNTDDWWLIDLESHRIAMWVPPTLEMMGKRSDAEEGFVKMYFATYNTVPRRMVQIYGAATS